MTNILTPLVRTYCVA